ncbi:biotin-dependent carboxyltransferase family protein [Sulfobacillus thermosulfidooxidans]|uniref:5-oxoprolinase subunit C family protein n=1 Tax=Sulfobacillus thermosulfidooxidans TaxID=28034 RepID=UPI0006B53B6E|nr:biotin-dependent carboxyltransferase family protein [Sulfobacillus thermosulfidooxidans]
MRTIHILKPGPFSHIQDLGRPGLEYLGLNRCGPLDFQSFVIAQTLVHNDLHEAAIEMSYQGLEFTSDHPLIFAVVGAENVRIDNEVYSGSVALMAKSQQLVQIGRLTQSRAYLAIQGGLDTPVILGSRSTDFTAGIGGWHGRSLRSGDRIPFKPVETARRMTGHTAPHWAYYSTEEPLKVVLGPHAYEFSSHTLETFFKESYTINKLSNIMGIRLMGTPVPPHNQAANRLSEGTVPGAIQVPPDGQPIVLLNQRGTIGGYPIIATLLGPELWRLAQWPMASPLSFAAMSLRAAQSLSRSVYQRLMAWREQVMAGP